MLRILIVIYYPLFSTLLFSKEIPIIVIAPSKKPQSISTVGTTVKILDENFLKILKSIFLGDVLSSNSTSTNFFKVVVTVHHQQFN